MPEKIGAFKTKEDPRPALEFDPWNPSRSFQGSNSSAQIQGANPGWKSKNQEISSLYPPPFLEF